jgi:hypothetical protein
MIRGCPLYAWCHGSETDWVARPTDAVPVLWSWNWNIGELVVTPARRRRLGTQKARQLAELLEGRWFGLALRRSPCFWRTDAGQFGAPRRRPLRGSVRGMAPHLRVHAQAARKSL